MDGTGSVLTNSSMQAHKKYYAFEDAVGMKAGSTYICLIVIFYLVALVASIFFAFFIRVNISKKNKEFEGRNDIVTVFFEYAFENHIAYSKILRAIAYNEGLIEKDA